MTEFDLGGIAARAISGSPFIAHVSHRTIRTLRTKIPPRTTQSKDSAFADWFDRLRMQERHRHNSRHRLAVARNHARLPVPRLDQNSRQLRPSLLHAAC